MILYYIKRVALRLMSARGRNYFHRVFRSSAEKQTTEEIVKQYYYIMFIVDVVYGSRVD